MTMNQSSSSNAGIRSLGEAVASDFEAQAAAAATATAGSNSHHHQQPPPPLPSPITLYRTGRILYYTTTWCQSKQHVRDHGDCHRNTTSITASIVIHSFESMMASLPRNYVHHVLLHGLHISYASLILSFASSSSSSTSSPAIILSSLTNILAKYQYPECTTTASCCTWNDILEGTQSLCGIYMCSVNACRCCCCYNRTFSSSSGDDDEEEEEGRRHDDEPMIVLAVVSLAWVHDYLSKKKEIGDDDTTQQQHEEDEILQISILRTLSRLLKYGLVDNTYGKNELDVEEQLSHILTVIQNIHSALSGGEDEDCTTILGDIVLEEDALSGEESFVAAIASKLGVNNGNHSSQPPLPQLQYLLEMLKSFVPRSKIRSKLPEQSSTMENHAPSPEPIQKSQLNSLTDIQIAHIKSILPNLGDGFIEEALNCYSFNLERTVEALLLLSDDDEEEKVGNAAATSSTTIHPRLLAIPTNLPRKLRESVDRYSANVNLHRGGGGGGATTTTIPKEEEDGKEHARIQKEFLRRVERKAEEDAYLMERVSRMENTTSARASTTTTTKTYMKKEGVRRDDDYDDDDVMHDEYDDDYDDQYDGIGEDGGMAGGIGGLDEGLYDMEIRGNKGRMKNDQDMWRKYNTLIREDEAERRYWQDNQNLNRTTAEEGGNGNAAAEIRYRGPDKGRGGRLIGPDGKYLPLNHGGKKGGGSTGGGGGGGSGRGVRTGTNKGESGVGRGRGGRGASTQAETSANSSSQGGSKVDSELSKLQKRRKNDNKAKIGNHNRKDRATRKTAGIIPQG